MKKNILILSLSFVLFSCSINDDQEYTYEVTPVYQVVMPTNFAKDSITYIPLKYKFPTKCHVFNNFYYESIENIRTVAIEAIKVNQSNCQADNETVYEKTLKFRPATIGTYHFKFWTGTNDDDLDEFIEYDIVVNH